MWNLQHIVFTWSSRYWQIFKSALVYLSAYAKVFKTIPTINEAAALIKYIPCDCKWELDVARYTSNQKENNETLLWNKIIIHAKEIVVGIVRCLWENVFKVFKNNCWNSNYE